MRGILISGDQRCGLISVFWWIKMLVLCGNDPIWCIKKVYFYLLRLWNLTKKKKERHSAGTLNLVSVAERQHSWLIRQEFRTMFTKQFWWAIRSVSWYTWITPFDSLLLRSRVHALSVSYLYPFCGSLLIAVLLHKCTLVLQVLLFSLIICGICFFTDVTGTDNRFIVTFVLFFFCGPKLTLIHLWSLFHWFCFSQTVLQSKVTGCKTCSFLSSFLIFFMSFVSSWLYHYSRFSFCNCLLIILVVFQFVFCFLFLLIPYYFFFCHCF